MPSDARNGTQKRNRRTSRRALLKRTLVVLGAAAIVQPYGGVLATEAVPSHSKKGHHKPKNTPGILTPAQKKASDNRKKEKLLEEEQQQAESKLNNQK
jgi:hypothetical protein